MSQYAVLVGCNYYALGNTQNNVLFGCCNDVRNVRDLLQSIYHFPQNNITLLSDDQDPALPTFSSKANILNTVHSMIAKAQPGDILYFHYSGHGMLTQRQNTINIMYPNASDCIIPTDVLAGGGYDPSKEITDDEWWQIVSTIPAGITLFAVFDSCHSGTQMELAYSMILTPGIPGTFHLQDIERHPETAANVVMLSGCKDDQTSLDAVDNLGRPAGALTYAFCTYIRNHSSIQISYVDFLSSIRNQIISNNPGVPDVQIPQLDFGRLGDCGKPFSLIPKPIKDVKDITSKSKHQQLHGDILLSDIVSLLKSCQQIKVSLGSLLKAIDGLRDLRK